MQRRRPSQKGRRHQLTNTGTNNWSVPQHVSNKHTKSLVWRLDKDKLKDKENAFRYTTTWCCTTHQCLDPFSPGASQNFLHHVHGCADKLSTQVLEVSPSCLALFYSYSLTTMLRDLKLVLCSLSTLPMWPTPTLYYLWSSKYDELVWSNLQHNSKAMFVYVDRHGLSGTMWKNLHSLQCSTTAPVSVISFNLK